MLISATLRDEMFMDEFKAGVEGPMKMDGFKMAGAGTKEFVVYWFNVAEVARVFPVKIDRKLFSFHRKTDRSYRELEARKNRLNQLEKIYLDMSMQKELQKKGRKRKLREDEIVCPTTKPVYKWRAERKR
ncbi:hypothetical protein VNO77_05346 [Canavalia gladiata]|uniref:Uncharacterized protein n=1 Tax=Canavalia gladiata TaxID=3824 RepID=A0AAN9RE24_CANGL